MGQVAYHVTREDCFKDTLAGRGNCLWALHIPSQGFLSNSSWMMLTYERNDLLSLRTVNYDHSRSFVKCKVCRYDRFEYSVIYTARPDIHKMVGGSMHRFGWI